METSTLTTTTTDALKAEVSPVKVNATAMVIKAPEHVELARDFIRGIKERRAKVDETFDKHIKAAHQAHKDLVATKRTFTDDLDEAEKIIKRKVGDYNVEQERLALEAQQKAQREAEAENNRKIEAARKKIAAAMEKSGNLQEQIDSVQAIIEDENTNDTDLELAERQLEVLKRQQQRILDQAQVQQEKAEDIAAAPAYIAPAAVVEKTKGVGVKKVYLVTAVDSSKLIAAIAGGKYPATLVKSWDETTIKKMAGMGVFLPGVTYQEDRTVRIT